MSGFVVDVSYGGACVVVEAGCPAIGAKIDLTMGVEESLRAEVIYLCLESENPKVRDHCGLKFLEPWETRITTLTPVLERCPDHGY